MTHSSLTGSETVQYVATGLYIFLFSQMLTKPAIQIRFPDIGWLILAVFILLQPRPDFWAIFAIRDQCVPRVGIGADGWKAFYQSGLNAKITSIYRFSNRVKVANLVRASANTTTIASVLRFFYPHSPLLVTSQRPRRTNIDAWGISAVST